MLTRFLIEYSILHGYNYDQPVEILKQIENAAGIIETDIDLVKLFLIVVRECDEVFDEYHRNINREKHFAYLKDRDGFFVITLTPVELPFEGDPLLKPL